MCTGWCTTRQAQQTWTFRSSNTGNRRCQRGFNMRILPQSSVDLYLTALLVSKAAQPATISLLMTGGCNLSKIS